MWMSLGEKTNVHRFGWELVAYFVIVIAAAVASFVWFERPVEKWIKDRYARPAIKVTLAAQSLG